MPPPGAMYSEMTSKGGSGLIFQGLLDRAEERIAIGLIG